MHTTTKKDNIWRALCDFGKNILAHVNINYEGAQGKLHIDITFNEYHNMNSKDC